MMQRSALRMLLLLLTGKLLLPLGAAEITPSSTAQDISAPAQGTLNSTNVFHPVSPGPLDGQIALVTARMLEKYHYLRQPFDSTVSIKFLDRYLEMFDPQHLHFLQSDLAEFAPYRTNLDHLTVPDHGAADAKPASEIFNRFVQRLQQRVTYADQLLHSEKFTFDADEHVVLNRKDQPYPKDLNELVTEKYLPRLPEPPYGMKFVYDANTGQAKVVQK